MSSKDDFSFIVLEIFLVDLMESFLTGGNGGRLRLFSVKLTLLEKRESTGSDSTEESYISDSKLSFEKLLLTFSGEEDRAEEFVTRGSEDTEEDSEMPESRALLSDGVAVVSHLNTSLAS